MKITTAECEYLDVTDRPIKGLDRVVLTASTADTDGASRNAPQADVEMATFNDQARAWIYREVRDPERAQGIGNEGPWVRTDWFAVYDTRLDWWGNILVVSGIQQGARGILRDGVSPYSGRPHGIPDETREEPLYRVRWRLS